MEIFNAYWQALLVTLGSPAPFWAKLVFTTPLIAVIGILMLMLAILIEEVIYRVRGF